MRRSAASSLRRDAISKENGTVHRKLPAARLAVAGGRFVTSAPGARAASAGASSMPVASGVEAAAWIGPLDDVAYVRVFLDHDVLGVAFDHVLGLEDLVAGRERKPVRVSLHRLVLRARQADQLVAAEATTLTAKGDHRVGWFCAHAVVDPAKRRLVHRDALLGLVLHPASPHRSARVAANLAERHVAVLPPRRKRMRTRVPGAVCSSSNSSLPCLISGNPSP